MPVDLINRTLETELEPGEVILTARAQDHIAAAHQGDHDLVMQWLAEVIARPTYVGQSPHHGDEFEIVRRIVRPGTDALILAAVNLTRNRFGNYSVHSAYRISQKTVDRRIARGHLRIPKK